MSDLIRLICPNLRCRAILSVPRAARGRNVRCRQCGQRVRVPAPGLAAQPKVIEPEPSVETENNPS